MIKIFNLFKIFFIKFILNIYKFLNINKLNIFIYFNYYYSIIYKPNSFFIPIYFYSSNFDLIIQKFDYYFKS